MRRSTIEEMKPEETTAGEDPIPPSLMHTLLHDLNAPLQSVIGFAELLLDERRRSGGATAEEGGSAAHRESEFLERIRGAGWEMARLLRATATVWDPAGSGSEDGSRTPVETLLTTAAREAGEGERGAGVDVRVDVADGTPAVHGRAERLVQAFRYLMESAAAGRARTTRSVVTARAAADAGGVVVEIEGPGTEEPGAASELLPESIEAVGRGTEVRERRRRLEVVTARRILRAHGGCVALESAPQGRARLRIVLPAIGGER